MVEKRLLVLDDDENVAAIVAMVAARHGFLVRTTDSPEEFFACIGTWAPTHIAVDLVMPMMDGVEILRSLAATGCAARIIVMSGIGAQILESAGRGAAGRGLNIRGILHKPFKPADLRALLDEPPAPQSDPDCANPAGRVPDDPALEQALAQALRNHELVLHYQPKIHIATGKVAGFEALVRWQHPSLGLIFPERFIGTAERLGLMSLLTPRILQIGLDWLRAVESGPPVSLAINVSASNLCDLDFADVMHEQCVRCGIDPRRITLELTETGAPQDRGAALDILTRIRIKGFNLSIDDFGTGYSFMIQLAELPVSEIKIDKSFVMSMATSEAPRKIVESTIRLGKSLGLTTVAEGVENAATLQMLGDLGCDLAQGFHIARGMEGPAALQWLADWDGPARGR